MNVLVCKTCREGEEVDLPYKVPEDSPHRGHMGLIISEADSIEQAVRLALWPGP